jgi:hypothetical protein
MTKKLQAVMLALVAAFVFSALLAEVASAETTLLAEWLANGAEITTNLNSQTSGSLLLEDTSTIAGSSAVKCSAILDGTIGANGADEITKVLNLKGEEIGALGGLALLGEGAGTDCQTVTGCAEGSAASPIEVWPVGLPWKTELFLMENGEFLDLVSATEVGYEILCLIFSLNAEDKCTATDGEVLIQNDPVTGDADTPVNSVVTPNAFCTQSSNKQTGVNETTEVASTMTLESGELLTVSSV